MPQIPSHSDLVADFDLFLSYLRTKQNLPLTGAGELKGTDLYALNERVQYPSPFVVTPKSRVADYPFLGFLFQVATAGRLFAVQMGKANTLAPVAARLETYENMTAEEKYMFILETAWCYVDWATLDGDDRSGMGSMWFREGVDSLLKNPVGVWARLIERGWLAESEPQTIHIFLNVNIYARAGYWLGWYEMDERPQTKRDKYSLAIDRVALTEWGRDCLSLLRLYRPFHFWNENSDRYFDSEADEDYDEPVDMSTFLAAFRTECNEPDLLSLYPFNPNPPTGTYWLRVEIPAHKVSRTLAMPAEATLNDLHLLIQKAFAFDNDHLYGFYLNPRNPYNGKQFFDPRTVPGMADGYPAAKVTLDYLNLYEGQRLLYIFDFGDNWEFSITLARHLPDEKTAKGSIIEQVGEAPQQYADDEDDDDDNW